MNSYIYFNHLSHFECEVDLEHMIHYALVHDWPSNSDIDDSGERHSPLLMCSMSTGYTSSAPSLERLRLGDTERPIDVP